MQPALSLTSQRALAELSPLGGGCGAAWLRHADSTRLQLIRQLSRRRVERAG
jgi:hypothetical protein